MPKGHPQHYSVYENGTDQPICIHATAAQCAAALGVDPHTFYTYVAKRRKNHSQPPGGFRIYFDEEDDMGEAGL